MRGGMRKGTGGIMPGAGRKPDLLLTRPRAMRLTEPQTEVFQEQSGSAWLQGWLNLELRK